MAQLQRSDATLLDNWWLRIGASRTIDATPERVWSIVGDESTWLTWYRPLSVFSPVGEPTTGIGATFDEQESLWKTRSEIVIKEPEVEIALTTLSINMRGLLSKYYRSLRLEPSDDGQSTVVHLTGAFRFGPLGWTLFPYTYPQMTISMYVEYRSALKGLADALSDQT